MSSLLISGGRVIDPANNLDAIADVLIIDGKIAAVTPIGERAGFSPPADLPQPEPIQDDLSAGKTEESEKSSS